MTNFSSPRRSLVFATAIFMLLAPFRGNSQTASIESSPFGKLSTGEEVTSYTLVNNNGMQVSVLDYGGIITSIFTLDKIGRLGDVALGFDNLEDYEKRNPYFGALVGRYANRIANGRFSLDGKQYTLVQNNGTNHIHGGTMGFDKAIWSVKPVKMVDRVALELTLTSPDMEEGYPGNLECTVTYTLTDQNELKVSYRATTDKKTILNLTQHSYFNLSADFSQPILDHELSIAADQFVPVDEKLIPLGKYADVEGTPFDFTSAKRIGQDIEDGHEQIKIGNGYDHSWVLRDFNSSIRKVASVWHERSGRLMEVYTTEPGMQLYTGNFLDGTLPAKDGGVYERRSGFCLETQHHPDSPNQPEFPSVVLEPGQTYRSETTYKFSIKK